MHPRQYAAGERHPARRHEGHRHVAGETRDDAPIKPQACRRFAVRLRLRRGGDGGRIEVRINEPLRHHAGAVDARQSHAADDAFAGHAPVRPFEMRPDGEFFRPDRAEVDMAGLRRHRREAPVGLDQRGDAQSGARA